MKTKTLLTEREAIVLAAWFARSNLGMPNPSRKEVERLLSATYLTLSGATLALCQKFMESDEHEQMFLDEAKSWLKDFSKKYKTREAVLEIWPDVKGDFWPPEQ